MSKINGKAIYSPKGKAGEYAKYACNFYVGCSNDCDYCYCKRGVLGHAMGKPQATLKKCFKNEEHALEVFKKELSANIVELQHHGLFFTFTSDPFIDECKRLTIAAVYEAVGNGVPCKILTKRADFIDDLPREWYINPHYLSRIAFGFTMTGHDELERGASTNDERVAAMKTLHMIGFRTFASIEPVVTIDASMEVIRKAMRHCNLFKIGLMSGKRNYTPEEVEAFVKSIMSIVIEHNRTNSRNTKVYWKESVRDYIDKDCSVIPYCVKSDYNIFNTLPI